MIPFDITQLKKITREITQNITSISPVSSTIEYDISNPETVLIKRSEGEGKTPIFDRCDATVNKHKNGDDNSYETSTLDINTSNSLRNLPTKDIDEVQTIVEKALSDNPRCSQSSDYRSRSPSPIENAVKKLDEILDGMQQCSRNIDRQVNGPLTSKDEIIKLYKDSIKKSSEVLKDLTDLDSRKRQRNDSDRHSRSSSKNRYSNSRDSSVISRSPTPKRTKKEFSSKYGHSSKYENNTTMRSRRSSNKHRDRSYNRSPSSSRKYSDLPRRQVSDTIKSFLSDESTYNRHSFMEKDGRRHNRYYDKCSRRSRDRQNNHYQSSHFEQTYASDLEDRYYRYYSVMCAFTIIMDILRQDGM